MKDRPRTPIETLYKAREIGVAAGLHYVYLGNVFEAEYRHTYCHHCGRKLIDRSQMVGEPVGLQNGGCSECGHKLPGLGIEVIQEPSGVHGS